MMPFNRKILFVDDDERYRDSVIALLDNSGFEFLQADTVPEALRLLQDHADVQVVLLDLQLGETSGTDLLESIKDRISNYRVIVLTAHEELLEAKKAAYYKVFSYVAKTHDSFREALLFHINDAFAAIERAWLGKKVDAHLEIVRRIDHLGFGANHDADQQLRGVLDLICDLAIDLLDAYTCHIRIVDPGRGDFVLWASRGRIQNVESIFEERAPLSQAYSGIAAETKKGIIVGNLQDDEPFQKMKQKALSNVVLGLEYREYLDRVRSAYVVPISTGVYGNDIDCVFNINSDVEGFFLTEERQELVHDFVSQTDLAITKHLLKKKRIDIHADYRNIGAMLWEISNVFIAGENDLDKIYSIVFKGISDGLGPEIISIFLLDEEAKKLKNVAEYRADKSVEPLDEQYAPGVGIVGRVYSEGQTKVFVTRQDAVSGETEPDSLPEGFNDENITNIPSGKLRHYLGVPIKFGNDTLGVIRAINKRSEHYDSEEKKTNSICLLKRGFSEDCQNELEITANHLAATIKNAELIGELNKTVNQLESLYAVGHIISYGQDVNAVFDLIVQSAAQVMHGEICMLFLKRGDRVVLTQSFGMPPINGAFYELNLGKTGRVAATGELILEAQASGSHKGKYDDEIVAFLQAKHGTDHKGIESFMAVPIMGKDGITGVIKVINKVEPPFKFDNRDLKLFQLFADQIGGLERFLDTQRYVEGVIENSPDPIIFLDEKGRIKLFNKACELLWGYTNDEAIGKSITDFYASEEKAREIGRRLWNTEDHRVHNVDAEIRDKNTALIPVRLSAAFLFDEEGRRIGSFGVFKDVREIRHLEDLVLRSENEAVIGKLAPNVSHDIKTKIGAVLIYLDTLKYDSDSKGETELSQVYAKMEDALRSAVQKLKSLIQAVQPTAPRKEVVCLDDIFDSEICGAMSREANGRGVEFELNYADGKHELEVDVDQIRGALWHLFNNSLDAIATHLASGTAQEKGRIEVSARVKDGNLELEWRDNGCGISDKKKTLVFGCFYTDKEHGTGLGLHMVKQNIEGHGGTVSVESSAGKGATFSLIVPAQTESKHAAGK